MSELKKVTTVPSVDLNRYLGTWFEIARLPLRWEEESASDITATYTLEEGGVIRVDNRCLDGEGKPIQAVGEAVPSDSSNARLVVAFLPKYLRWIPFTKGECWVLKIDPDYRAALVGTPDRKHLWLLSRTPHLEEVIDDNFLAAARAQGFDLSALIRPAQSGNKVEDSLVQN